MGSDRSPVRRVRQQLAALPFLRRVQATTLAFGVIIVLTMSIQLVTQPPSVRLLLALGSLPLTASVLVLTFLLRRVTVLEPVLPLTVVLVGPILTDPMAVLGVILAVVVAQSLYGSTFIAAGRTVVLMAALPLAISLSGNARFAWHESEVLSALPVVALFAVLIRVLKVSLDGQAETSAREALLASTSRQLLGCTDPDEVRAIELSARTSLVRMTPGLIMVELARDGSRAQIKAVAGSAADLVGTTLPISDAARADPAALNGLFGRYRYWASVGLEHDILGEEARDLLLLGRGRPIPRALMEAVDTLGAQLSMAVTACRTYGELEHRAHHDELTAMPNRAVLVHRLRRAVETAHATGVTAALMVVDLDDFKAVNDTYGHAAGDALLVEIARRMAEEVGHEQLAARFGGDEFAVLMPQVADPEQALRLAHALRSRLLEPIELPQATVKVGCSIGLAFSEAGRTAGDLLRCADVAMYAAKARGKNRVEQFSEQRHGEMADDRWTQLQR